MDIFDTPLPIFHEDPPRRGEIVVGQEPSAVRLLSRRIEIPGVLLLCCDDQYRGDAVLHSRIRFTQQGLELIRNVPGVSNVQPTQDPYMVTLARGELFTWSEIFGGIATMMHGENQAQILTT